MVGAPQKSELCGNFLGKFNKKMTKKYGPIHLL